MDIDRLITHFRQNLTLNDGEIEIVRSVFKEKRIKKKQYLLQAGDICHYNTFVVEGCLRLYMLDKNGKEHNLQFAIENWWILDMESFYRDTASKLNIEAIENTVVFQIKKEDQIKLFVEYPKFNRIFRVLCENAYIAGQKRILLNISASAEEKYQNFLDEYPHLYHRISNVQIASYIGVTPEFLSAIRKRRSKS
jgi:CRP-like cAMP-binding protein